MLKSISVSPCLTFRKYFEIIEEGTSSEIFDSMAAIKKRSIDKVRRATEEKSPRSFKSRNSAEVNVKSL